MSTETQNYNLTKPEANDFFDINDQNGNMDVIDQALKDNANGIGNNSTAISGNAGAINANTGNISKHEENVFGMKGGLDLSGGDVTLQSADYYKGLLVVSAAHESYSLILPITNNPKYDIYNADSSKALLIKKSGGTEIIKIPPKSFGRVAYDGTEYRLLSSENPNTYENPSPIKAGDAVAGNLLAYNRENSQWEKGEFGAIYDGKNIIGSGKLESANFFSSGDVGYRLYRQDDGTISTDVRSLEFYLGWIESTDVGWIGMLGGVEKDYTDSMETFIAVPDKSTQVAIKIKKPSSADGVMIRRSLSQYDGSGIVWGDLVFDITDDSNYYGHNNFYYDTGLANSGHYYYKAFPYIGSTYNTVGGENESDCYCRQGLHYWTFDNVSGSSVYDEWGSRTLTMTSGVFSDGPIGDEAYLSSNGYFNLNTSYDFPYTGYTINCLLTFDGTDTWIFTDGSYLSSFYRGYEVKVNSAGNFEYRHPNNGGNNSSGNGTLITNSRTLGLVAGNTYNLSIYIYAPYSDGATHTVKVRVDAGTEQSIVDGAGRGDSDLNQAIGANGMGSSLAGSGGRFDEYRVYAGELADEDVINLNALRSVA